MENNVVTASMDDLVLYADVLQSLITHHEGRKKLPRPKGHVVCDNIYLDELSKDIISHVFEAANAEEILVVFRESVAFPSKYKSIRQFFKFFLKTVNLENVLVTQMRLDFGEKETTTLTNEVHKRTGGARAEEVALQIHETPSAIQPNKKEPMTYQMLRALITSVKSKTTYLHIVKTRMLFILNEYIDLINKDEDEYYVEELVGDLYDALDSVVDDPKVYIKDFINLDDLSTEQGIGVGVEHLNSKEFYINKDYEDLNNMEKHMFWLWVFSNPDNTFESIELEYGISKNKIKAHYDSCVK